MAREGHLVLHCERAASEGMHLSGWDRHSGTAMPLASHVPQVAST